jgi:hypothetical protein
MVMLLLWDLLVHLLHLKPLGVSDRVALHLLFCLQFISPSLKDDYFVGVLLLGYI